MTDEHDTADQPDRAGQPMRVSPEAAEAIRRIESLTDQALSLVAGLPDRRDRIQVGTWLARLLTHHAEPVLDQSGNPVSQAESLRTRLAAQRTADFTAAHRSTGPDRMSLQHLADLAGIAKGSVQSIIGYGTGRSARPLRRGEPSD